MLDKQTITIAFNEGIDTKADDILSSDPEVLENGFIGQEGTIRKRNGFTELSSSADYGSITGGELLLTSKNTLAMVSQSGAYVYNPSMATPWTARSFNQPTKFYQVGLKAFTPPRLSGYCGSTMSEQSGSDTVIAVNGYTPGINTPLSCGNGLFYINNQTGSMRYSNVDGSSNYLDSCQLVKVSGKLIFAQKNSDSIFAADVTTYSATPSLTALVTDSTTTLSKYAVYSLNNKLIVCYVNSSGKPVAKFFDSSLSLLGTFVATELGTVDNGFAFAWDSVNSKYVFFYSIGFMATLKAVIINTSYTQVGSTTTVALSAGGLKDYSKTAIFDSSSSSICVVLERAKATSSERDVSTYSFSTTTANFTSGLTIADARIVTAVSIIDSTPKFIIAKETNDDNGAGTIYNNFLVDQSFNVYAKITNEYNDKNIYDTVLSNYSGQFLVPISNQGPQIVTLTLSSFTCSNPKELIETGVFALSGIWEFDGAVITESGFAHAPKIIGVTVSSGLVDIGDYSYIAVYEYYDARGNRHLSKPSQPYPVTVTSTTKKLVFDITPLELTYKDASSVKTLIYRKASAESVYSLVSSSSYDNYAGSPLGNELLYTTGGVLENDSPIVTNYIWEHGDRLFAINEERPNIVCFSNKTSVNDILSNNRGLEFSNFLFIGVNDNKTGLDDRVTGGASLDDKLIIFKNQSIYAVFGDGPNELGQGAFSEPKLISTDVGCSEVRSIVLSSDGVFFKSQRGIYLLTRTLEVVYVGAQVEGFNSLEITSAVLMPNITQVRFTTRNGVALVYNYYTKQWSTFTNYDANHALSWLGAYTHLKSTGKVRVESSGFLDIAATICLRFRTGWTKLSGIQNLQRIYRMMIIGHWKSSHNLNCDVSYDYENFVSDSYGITMLTNYNRTDKPTSSQVYSGENDGVYQFEIHPSRQKCQSIKFEIYDTSITGESFALTGLSLVAGIKKGLNKLSSNKKF